jgi:hypothetical protein
MYGIGSPCFQVQRTYVGSPYFQVQSTHNIGSLDFQIPRTRVDSPGFQACTFVLVHNNSRGPDNYECAKASPAKCYQFRLKTRSLDRLGISYSRLTRYRCNSSRSSLQRGRGGSPVIKNVKACQSFFGLFVGSCLFCLPKLKLTDPWTPSLVIRIAALSLAYPVQACVPDDSHITLFCDILL